MRTQRGGRLLVLLLGVGLSIGLLAALEALVRVESVRALVPARAPQTGAWQAPDREKSERLAAALDAGFVDELRYEPPPDSDRITRADLDYTRKLPPDYRSEEHRLVPSRATRSVVTLRRDATPLYDVTYTIDRHARRRTLPPQQGPHANIVVLGGSFAFGEGVEDDETLASQLARLLPAAEVVNLGIHGDGPNSTLRDLEQPELLRNQGVPRRPGVAVYLYIDHHLDRVVPRIHVIRGRPGVLARPAYAIEDGRARYAGTFYQTAKLRSLALLALSKSELLLHLGIDFPRRFGEEHFVLVARIVEEMQRVSAERFGTGKLYFVPWPGASASSGEAVAGAIASDDVVVVDLHRVDIRLLTGGLAFHPGDGHPTPLAHAVVAQLVARALRNDPALSSPPRTPTPSGAR